MTSDFRNFISAGTLLLASLLCMHLQANMTTFSLVEGENLFLLPIFVSFGQLSVFFFISMMSPTFACLAKTKKKCKPQNNESVTNF